jgi:hypothetical protein
VKFGAYVSNIVIPEDVWLLTPANFRYLQALDDLLSPDDIRRFSPSQAIWADEFAVVRNKIEEWINAWAITDKDYADKVRKIYSKEWMNTYFDNYRWRFTLNELWMRELWIERIVPDINEIWLDAVDMNFFNAIDNAIQKGITLPVSPEDIQAMRASWSWQRVKDFVDRVNPCT